MKRNEFLKLAGIGLVATMINPRMLAKKDTEVLYESDIHEMLSKGFPIENKTFKFYKPVDLSKYDHIEMRNNHFVLIGNNTMVTFSSKTKGYIINNLFEQKKRFLFN